MHHKRPPAPIWVLQACCCHPDPWCRTATGRTNYSVARSHPDGQAKLVVQLLIQKGVASQTPKVSV